MTQAILDFDGLTFHRDDDGERLTTQLRTVRDLMRDGQWRTLQEIEAATGFPQASISARLRDLRKPKFGGYIINRRRRGNSDKGIHEYQCQRHLPMGGRSEA